MSKCRKVDMSKGETPCPCVLPYDTDGSYWCCSLIAGHDGAHENVFGTRGNQATWYVPETADLRDQLAAAEARATAATERAERAEALLREAWSAIAGYPFRNDVTARIAAFLGGEMPMTLDQVKEALEVGARERAEAETRTGLPGRYRGASPTPAPERGTGEEKP